MQTMAQRQAEFRRAQLGKHETTWPAGLAPEARAVLESFLLSGQRVRIFHGDPATGEAWPEEWDTTGRISRTMGAGPHPIRAAMLVPDRKDCGSPLSASIVAVMTAPGSFAYRHPSFHVGQWTVRETPADADPPSVAKHLPFETLHNGELYGRHKTRADAERLVAFMKGERMLARRNAGEPA